MSEANSGLATKLAAVFGEKNDLRFGYEITEFSFKSSPATKKTRRLNGLTAVCFWLFCLVPRSGALAATA